MPRQRAPVEQVGGRVKKSFFRARGFAGESRVAKTEPPDGREKNSRVQFRRALSEASPVNDAWAVAEIEEVIGVKPAIHEARRTLAQLRAREQRNEREG